MIINSDLSVAVKIILGNGGSIICLILDKDISMHDYFELS
jgi:hypothetical protein